MLNLCSALTPGSSLSSHQPLVPSRVRPAEQLSQGMRASAYSSWGAAGFSQRPLQTWQIPAMSSSVMVGLLWCSLENAYIPSLFGACRPHQECQATPVNAYYLMKIALIVFYFVIIYSRRN